MIKIPYQNNSLWWKPILLMVFGLLGTGWQTEKLTQTFVCQSFAASWGEFLPNQRNCSWKKNKKKPRHPKSSKYLVSIRFVTLKNLSSHEMSWGVQTHSQPILIFGMTGCLGRFLANSLNSPSRWLSTLNPDYFSLRICYEWKGFDRKTWRNREESTCRNFILR